MPPNFHLFRVLTSATFLKTHTTFRHVKFISAIAQSPGPKRFFHTPTSICGSSGKEITANDDILMQNLTSASTVEDVLELLQRHLSVMNSQHQLQALSSLFNTHKSSTFSLSKEEIIKTREFKALCNTVLDQSRQMNVNSQINCLKFLAYFGVPGRTRIIQCLLNLISKQVNDLSLQQITYMHFLLHFFEICPLIQALEIAFPIVFEVKLSKELDETNVSAIGEYLHYASSKPVSDSCFDLLVSNLTAYQGAIPLKSAVSILRSFCERRRTNDSIVVILYRISDIVAESIDELNHNDVYTLLSKVLHKATLSDHFIHTTFIDAAISRIITSNCEFWQKTSILKKLVKLDYVSFDLVEHICEKIEENPTLLPDSSFANSLTLLCALGNFNYKPKNWNTLQNILLNNFTKHIGTIELPWLRTCLLFIILDCWSPALLNKVLDVNFLHSFFQRENVQVDYRQLLNIYQAVKTVYPGVYSGPLPPQNIIEKAKAFADPFVEHPLLPSLLKGLGGPEYIHNDVFTLYGHYIDHVVVMRKGGYVVASNKDPNNLDEERRFLHDIEVPSESIVIAVLTIWPKNCAVNCDRVRGHVTLHQRTLEAMGIAVVPVLLNRWDSLLEHEKIPWLMQELKQKAIENEVMLQN